MESSIAVKCCNIQRNTRCLGTSFRSSGDVVLAEFGVARPDQEERSDQTGMSLWLWITENMQVLGQWGI